MLSVLEANAYAIEILCKIRYFESKDQKDELMFLESEVNNYLNSNKLSEYSLLLILCRKHFEYLTLKEYLIFYQVLARRILNMTGLNLSIISNFLKHTFLNNYIGDAICKELQRGLSRQVVVFKMILLIHKLIDVSEDGNNLIKIMKSDPENLIDIFFNWYEIPVSKSLDFGDHSEFSQTIGFLKREKLLDREIILRSSEYNHRVIQFNSWISLDLSKLKLLDSFLSDGTVINPPNNIGVNVKQYFDDNLDTFCNLDNICKDTQISKFHIHPDDIAMMM